MSMNVLEWQPDWFRMSQEEAEKAIIAWAIQEKEKKQVVIFDAEAILKSTAFKTTVTSYKKWKYTSTCGSLIIKWKRVGNIGLVTRIKRKDYYNAPKKLKDASGFTYIMQEVQEAQNAESN